MSDPTPIRQLTRQAVRAVLLDTLRSDTPVQTLSDFLVNVDWSKFGDERDPEVVALLGDAESIVTDTFENVIDTDEFAARVRALAARQPVPQR